MSYNISNSSSILITGGSGSLGKAFVKKILSEFPNIKRLVIFSRDELKQFEIASELDIARYPGLRFFLGDIRDGARINQALSGIDVVVHAAALKQVPAAEYNPFEFIQTNILGAQNLITACLNTNVKKVVALSTDKASSPINLYGATKLCSDKLFLAANNIKGNRELTFSVLRYGNVMGSRGSVIPFFKKMKKSGFIPITSEKMTRFNITLDESVQNVIWAISKSFGGEIIVPKLPSYSISELAKAIAPDCDIRIIGVRPGEKIHEEMISKYDSPQTLEFGEHYVIIPDANKAARENYISMYNANEVSPDFYYSSNNNEKFLNEIELRKLIVKCLGEDYL